MFCGVIDRSEMVYNTPHHTFSFSFSFSAPPTSRTTHNTHTHTHHTHYYLPSCPTKLASKKALTHTLPHHFTFHMTSSQVDCTVSYLFILLIMVAGEEVGGYVYYLERGGKYQPPAHHHHFYYISKSYPGAFDGTTTSARLFGGRKPSKSGNSAKIRDGSTKMVIHEGRREGRASTF